MVTPDGTMSPSLTLCLPALGVTTPLILASVDRALRGSRYEDAKNSIQIALAEALNNVVEHGYGADTLGAVAVCLRARPSELAVEITDWGKAYPDHVIPSGAPPDPAKLEEGGYGWYLIRTLMTTVTYERRRHANHLTLSLTV